MEGGIQLAVGSRIVGSKGSGAGFANVCAKDVAAMKLHQFSPLLKSKNSVEDIIAARHSIERSSPGWVGQGTQDRSCRGPRRALRAVGWRCRGPAPALQIHEGSSSF